MNPAADPRGSRSPVHLLRAWLAPHEFRRGAGDRAGHYLRIAFRADEKPALPAERKYWDFDFPDWGDEEDSTDGRGLIDEFEARFQRAVEIRLRADVPVVGYLSGGVDSAYVLATAARVAGHALPSFTVRVPDPSLDEVADAMEASRAIGGGRSSVVEAGPI